MKTILLLIAILAGCANDAPPKPADSINTDRKDPPKVPAPKMEGYWISGEMHRMTMPGEPDTPDVRVGCTVWINSITGHPLTCMGRNAAGNMDVLVEIK